MRLHLSSILRPKLLFLHRSKILAFKLDDKLRCRFARLTRAFFSCWAAGVLTISLAHGTLAAEQNNTKTEPPQILVLGFHKVPPIVYKDSQGRPAGELMEFQIKIIEDAGYQWVAFSYPGMRLHNALQAGRVHVYLGPALRAEYREKVLVSDFIIAFINMHLYSLTDTPPIHSLEELTDQRLVIVRGYTYGGWASHFKNPNSKLNVIEVNNHLQGMKMLKARRTTYFLGYDRAGHQVLENMSEKGIKYNPVMKTPMYTIISKKTANAHEVMSRISAAFNATSPSERPNGD